MKRRKKISENIESKFYFDSMRDSFALAVLGASREYAFSRHQRKSQSRLFHFCATKRIQKENYVNKKTLDLGFSLLLLLCNNNIIIIMLLDWAEDIMRDESMTKLLGDEGKECLCGNG